MKKLKKENGITLIVVIITVILLSILLTITLNAVINQNDVYDQMEGAKNEFNSAVSGTDNYVDGINSVLVSKDAIKSIKN